MKSKSRPDPTLDDVLRAYADHPEFRTPPRDVNARGSDNFVLNIAAYRGNLGHVRVLITNGARVNVQGDMSNTPLHDAAERGHVEVVEFLLQHGADVSLRNEFGKTALEEAVERGDRKIAAMVRKAAKR